MSLYALIVLGLIFFVTSIIGVVTGANSFIGSDSISNVKLRDGHPRDRLLSLWQRKHRQERDSAKRQAEIPVQRVRQTES